MSEMNITLLVGHFIFFYVTDWLGRQSGFAIMACDPYVFIEEEDNFEGTSMPDFNDSLMELFNASSSEEEEKEEEFFSFQAKDEHFGVQSRVKNFHHRGDKER